MAQNINILRVYALLTKIPHWQAGRRVKYVTYPLSQQPMGTSREAGRPSFQIREALLERGETEGAAVDHLEGEA